MCDYETGDHNTLRRHRMRHTGRKPYKCQYCGYACIQAISLKTHMKNKHPGLQGTFTCGQCKYRTVNEKSLQNHIEDHKRNGDDGVAVTDVFVTAASLDIVANGNQVMLQDIAANDKQVMLQDGVEQLMYTSLDVTSDSATTGAVYAGPVITVELPTHAYEACVSSGSQVMFTLESSDAGSPHDLTHLNVVIPVSCPDIGADDIGAIHCKATTFDVVASDKVAINATDRVELLCAAETDGVYAANTADTSIIVQNVIANMQTIPDMTEVSDVVDVS